MNSAGPAEIGRALDGASRSFSATRRLPSGERSRILEQIREGVEQRKAEFVESIVADARKPIRFAAAEVDRCLQTLRLASEEATRIGGEVLPVDADPRGENAWCVVERFPRGLVSALTPFNFPLNLAVHKVAPALSCGCPVLLKPSPRTPGPALLLAEEIARTDWPGEAFSVILCRNEDASPLWRDSRVAVVSFTGSDSVGWQIKAEASRKTVVLELGGNAGAIVAEDADLDDAISKLALSAFGYSGQVCIKAQRIFAARPIFDRFLEQFAARARELPSGDLRDPKTVLSPLIDEAAARRVETWIREAEAGGARRAAGGARDGAFLPPTVLTGVSRESRVWASEIFGPVAVIEPYDHFEEALADVNDSVYGLQAAVFTRDIGRIRRSFSELTAGAVIINDSPSLRIDNYPYGGEKASGFGREGVRAAILEYTQPRVLFIRG